ncbi:MAG: DNA recombination protein RmuC [Planctomycetota bacterium]
MPQLLLVLLIILNSAIVILLIVLLARGSTAKENQERTERIVKDEIAQNREELNKSLKSGLDTFLIQLSNLTKSNEDRLERMRVTVEERLKLLQDENSQKLEQMRVTVDEKLHSTLEKRLGESFKMVSERLELVHKGLGEMQTLASGVGDLKKVLTNIKTRGTWGEIQLGNLLEQILTLEQYAKNVVTKKGSSERVEFAIKLPGRDKNEGIVWLPIDAKFPLEDYQKLVEAQEQANPGLVDELGKLLENRIKAEAKDIKEKYIDPPHTTDFGILFLPVEGLYAEVLRRPGLCDLLQREYRVTITGPTTLAALLNSLQMGFRTLAIEKRSSEVWSVLGAIKTEFAKFGEMLDKTQKKLQEASNTIDDATKKSRTIEKKLNKVQELPLSPLGLSQAQDSDEKTAFDKQDVNLFGEVEEIEQ